MKKLLLALIDLHLHGRKWEKGRNQQPEANKVGWVHCKREFLSCQKNCEEPERLGYLRPEDALPYSSFSE